MSDFDPARERVANHTLAYLRRTEKRQDELLELIVRQQDLISRFDRRMDEMSRSMNEGFSTVHRDLNEMRSDMILMENRILNRVNVEYELTSRMTRLEEEMLDLSAKVDQRDQGSGTAP